MVGPQIGEIQFTELVVCQQIDGIHFTDGGLSADGRKHFYRWWKTFLQMVVCQQMVENIFTDGGRHLRIGGIHFTDDGKHLRIALCESSCVRRTRTRTVLSIATRCLFLGASRELTGFECD